MNAIVSSEEILAVTKSFKKNALLAEDGTILFNAEAEVLGVSEAVSSALWETVQYINGCVREGIYAVDEDLNVRVTPAGESFLASHVQAADSVTGWWELTEEGTTWLEVALGGAAALAVTAGIVLGGLSAAAGAVAAAVVLVALALYAAINAIWLKMKIGNERLKSQKNAVRLRWHYYRLAEFLDIFIAYQIDVEPMPPLK